MLFKKILWLLVILLSFFLVSAMLHPVVGSVVYTIIGEEKPMMLNVIKYPLVFLCILYATYLNKLRNDDNRRQYLITTKRIYPGLKKDLLGIIRSPSYLYEVIPFGIVLFLYLYVITPSAAYPPPAFLWKTGLFSGGVLVYGAGCLWMQNTLHKHWLSLLKVPEESEEDTAWRRFNNYHLRMYIYQFVMTACIFIAYFMNHYFVTFPVCVTPGLFLHCQLQGVKAIGERKDRNTPYKKYVWLQVLSAVAYGLAFFFGLFAPRI